MSYRLFCAVGLLIVTLPIAARACLWDSDTLSAEASGLPGVVDVITGRFDRNPPLYFEIRLRRARADLEKNPSNLAAFDDQAVACDRLGMGVEAIGLMSAKRQVLDRLPKDDPEVREHRYRYLANLGTFWAHRWFREGADRKHPEMLRRGRDLIRQAIALNPNAHFGREKYQLRAMEWILDPKDEDNLLGLPTVHAIRPTGLLAERGLGDAVEGLSGLIVLGNAWESIDIYEALGAALKAEGRSSLAYMASLRCAELAEDGKRSFHGEPTEGAVLAKRYRESHDSLMSGAKIRSEYERLRKLADARNRKRTEFMVAKLSAGRHPDTDPTFWSGYREPDKPLLSGWLWDATVRFAPWLIGALVALAIARKIRRRRQARAPA